MPLAGDDLVPDSVRLSTEIAEISAFAESSEAGWTRRVYSDPYRASRQWVAEKMRSAGLETRIDSVGNIIGRLPGRDSSKPALMTGSHTDTVQGGGRFDGVVGVLSGIEVARRLRETGTQLERDLYIVDFLGEEPNTFGISCVGSRAMAGLLTPEHLDRIDDEGRRLGDVMAAYGADPDKSLREGWKSGSLHAYIELHVEQGPLLESIGYPIGVVTAIAGIERLLVHFTGRPDHSGTMPMANRHDALVAAAEAILTVERVGCGAPVHGVSTTGRIESSPGALNVVPGSARIWGELRSVDKQWLSGAKKQVVEQIAADAEKRGVSTMVEWLNDQDPVPCSPTMQDRIAEAADGLGYKWQAVPSGAGHDAAHMAH
ncbi:MAG: M20 family metallo-hydrolase, partial [Nakamurella sp.]